MSVHMILSTLFLWTTWTCADKQLILVLTDVEVKLSDTPGKLVLENVISPQLLMPEVDVLTDSWRQIAQELKQGAASEEKPKFWEDFADRQEVFLDVPTFLHEHLVDSTEEFQYECEIHGTLVPGTPSNEELYTQVMQVESRDTIFRVLEDFPKVSPKSPHVGASTFTIGKCTKLYRDQDLQAQFVHVDIPSPYFHDGKSHFVMEGIVPMTQIAQSLSVTLPESSNEYVALAKAINAKALHPFDEKAWSRAFMKGDEMQIHAHSRTCEMLSRNPSRWYYQCKFLGDLNGARYSLETMQIEYQDQLIFNAIPRKPIVHVLEPNGNEKEHQVQILECLRRPGKWQLHFTPQQDKKFLVKRTSISLKVLSSDATKAYFSVSGIVPSEKVILENYDNPPQDFKHVLRELNKGAKERTISHSWYHRFRTDLPMLIPVSFKTFNHFTANGRKWSFQCRLKGDFQAFTDRMYSIETLHVEYETKLIMDVITRSPELKIDSPNGNVEVKTLRIQYCEKLDEKLSTPKL